MAPVQISGAWSRLPAIVANIQPIHLRRCADNEDEPDDVRLRRHQRLLRRLLTQALVRMIRDLVPTESLLPTQVFLSHAKADGVAGPGIAEQLRDTAAGYGQIDVFYDENDLPVSHVAALQS